MAIKQFNSVEGYSVGSTPNSVIDANRNVSGNAITATANITAPQLISNVAQGTAPFVVSSSTTVANLTANVAILAQALLQNTSTATTVYPTFTTSSANGNSSAVFNTSISANLGNASITATTFVGALSGAATTAGTVTTAAQPNITSVGTLTSLAVTGNANAGNVNATGTIVAPTIAANNNGTGQNFKVGDDVWIGDINTADTMSIQGQQNAANGFIIFGNNDTTAKFGRAGSGPLSYTGAMAISANITTPQFISNVATGTAPFVVTSTTQVANLSVATAGTATTAGTVTTAAQPNITSVGTLTSLGVNGTVTAAAFTANTGVFTGNGSGLSAIAGANVTGTVANATFATTAGTVTTAAQPNITSVTSSGGSFIVGNTSNGGIFIDRGQFVFNSYSGATEGGQIVLAWAGANGLTGQGNSTWNMDTDATNNYRLFYQNATGGTGVPITAYSANNNVLFSNNVNASTLTSTVATGTAPFVVTSTTQVANLSVATAGSATTAGTVTTAAQPNITSVSTSFSGLTFVANAQITMSGAGSQISGVNLVSANSFSGNGSSITGINASSIASGTLAQARLANSNVILGSTTLALGTTTTTIAGLSSVTSTTFVGALTGAATTAGTVTTAAQPNITSVGTLTSLGVNGTVTAVAFTANTGIFTGNGSGLSAIAGANVTGTVSSATSATTAGTVTTAAQPNITSVGTLTSATVTGNVAAGNLTTTGVLSVTGTGVSSIAGNLDMTSNTIINLATPTNSTDAATKQYVDDVAQGLNIHPSCNAATTTTLASISGGTITYNNGTAGVGATLTTTGSYTTIDGVTLSNGMRILVKNEATQANNGIYVRTSATVLTRATDFDSAVEIAGGDFTFVTAGTLYNSTGWVQIDEVNTVGTDPIVWEQFSGAGTYQAGTGLTLTGTTFSVNASQTQVTAVGTLTGLNSSGTITAPAFTANTGVFTGNGSGLTALTGANVTGTVPSATSATTAGTVTTAAQPNITSVGTLTSLGVSGTVTAPAFTANTGIFTGNGSGLSAIAGANVTGTVASATAATNASALLQNTSTATTVYPTFSTSSANGNSSAVINTGISANLGNASITATTFVGALSGAATSATTAGTVTTAAQPNITSVGTLTSLGVNGTITGTRLISNIATGTAPLTVTSTTQVANLNVAQAGVADAINVSAGTGNNFIIFANAATGNVSELTSTGLIANLSNNSITATTFVGALSGAATSATTAGTVTTNAQPNITSVGTLTGLTSSGAVTITNSTAATSRTTGALIVTGGIGANANSFFTNLNVASNIAYVAPNGANTINNQMLNGGTLAWSGNAGQLFSITDSMTGNIFTVNDVSGIPMISVDAGGNIQFAVSGGFVNYGVTTAITAAGSTQGTATALTRPINVISTVSSGANGIILPTVPAGARILIVNTSANSLNVYPPSGAVVNSAATNAAYSQPAGARLEYISTSTTQWYTLNATYG